MKTYFIKTPQFIQSFYKKYTWNVNTSKKEIYLSFDDGPTPIVTPFVLDTLKTHNAKATFFCIGKNIENHPELFQRIINEGHSIGNHTHNHLNGWLTKKDNYIKNVTQAQKLMTTNRQLFRPPYGKIKGSQAKKLIKKGYKIIMWSVLSGDFDKKITKETCLNNVITKTTSGDIVVFHDSKKASEKLQFVLPKVLEKFSEMGFVFKKL